MRPGFVLGEVANGLRRNASMVVSVVLVTFISLTFVGAAILMQMQIGQMKNFWYDRAQVGIYMCTAISPGETCTAGEASQGMGVRDSSPFVPRRPNSSPMKTIGIPGSINCRATPTGWPPSSRRRPPASGPRY